MSTKALTVVVAAVAALLMVGSAAAVPADWWNNSYHYRVNVTVNTSLYNRTDWPIEYQINFSNYGLKGEFDNNSVRVIEFNTTDNTTSEIISQFDKDAGFDNVTNAVGEVVWLINGSRPEYTIIQYFIYFDSSEFGLKEAPNYESDLKFTDQGGVSFEVNNTNISVRVHTNRINKTSGMIFAGFHDGTPIFDVSGGETVENIKYETIEDGAVGFDLVNNFEIENAGPVRITIKQVGDEIELTSGSTNPTGRANMTKRYTFYRNNTWLKINQTYTASLGVNWNPYSGAPLIDISRTAIFSGGASYGKDDSVPMNWSSAATSGMGIGLINLRQSGSGVNPGYKAGYLSSQDLLYMSATGSPEFTIGDSMSQITAVQFHKSSDEVPVEELRDRFLYDINTAQTQAEERIVALDPNTTHAVYNRNETILISGNISSDNYNLSSTANATLTAPSGATYNMTLTRSGTAYEGSYYIAWPDNETGVWNLSIRTYDEDGYLLNTSVQNFNVSDTYVVDINFKRDRGVVNLTMWANITVKTARNDTGIPGISWPDIACAYYNTSNMSQFTNVTNISEAIPGSGIYTANWTAPANWTYYFTCNATRYNNTGTQTEMFRTSKENMTTLEFTFNTSLQWSTSPFNVSFVKWNTNQTFVVRFNLTNVGDGVAYGTNVTFNFTNESWWVSNYTNPFLFGNMDPGNETIMDIEITVSNRTLPGIYNITANVTWNNTIPVVNSTIVWFNVTVEQNPVLETTTPSVDLTVSEDSTDRLNFTVFSAGNVPLNFVNYSCTTNGSVLCSNFAPVFSPQNFSNQVAGNQTNVTMTFTIPDGQPPNSSGHIGNVTIYYANQTVNVTINITVRESRNWTANTSTPCFKPVLPNTTGNACGILIENTGNVDLDFEITPAYNSSNHTNYTYADNTSFIVLANASKTILFNYNTTNTTTAQTNTTNYTINATDVLADPSDKTLNVTLDVVFGSDITFWNISHAELAQLDNLTINVTINDRLWAGNDVGDIWVSANISFNGTFIETVNLTNTTPLTPGAISDWSLNYTNTTQRGINFSVTVFTEDWIGGYAEDTNEKNYTVYATLVMRVEPTKSTLRYTPGESIRFSIWVNDSAPVPLADVNVTIYVNDSFGDPVPDTPVSKLTTLNKVTTDSFDALEYIGDWNWTAVGTYYDSVADKNVTGTVSGAFRVDYPKDVTVQTDSTQYKGTNFSVKVYVSQYANLTTVEGPVIVVIKYGGVPVDTQTAAHKGDYYEATMSMASNASEGAYTAVAYAYDGAAEPYTGFAPFTVPATPIESLTLEITAGDSYQPGDLVEITAFLSDQTSDYKDDANITLWITDPNSTATIINMTAVNTTTPPKYTANYTLPNNATPGAYILFGNVTYSGVQASDVDVFTVSESIYTQIQINPVIYTNQTMNVGITVIDPGNGKGIDPDEMTLLLYNTENNTLTLWKNYTLVGGNFTGGGPTNPGLYSLTDNVSNGTLTGSYVAILEIKKGALRGYSMESFAVSSGVFDVRIENILDIAATDDTLYFDIILSYFGESVTRDVKVKFWIKDTGFSNLGGEMVANPTPGIPVTLNRNLSVSLSAGVTYTLMATVLYDEAQPPATAFKTFKVGGGGGGPPPAGGGGGGGPKEEEGIPKLSIIEIIPPEVLVEKGGIGYLVVSVQNLGGGDVNNVTTHITGVPLDWFEILTGEADVLTSGEGTNIIVQFKIPEEVIAQSIKLRVQAVNASEVSDEREVTMRIFASRYDLVHFEIQSVKKTMRNAEDRALRAIGEGKNASAVMEKLEEVKEEIRSAEDFLSDQEFEKALSHLDGARDVLEHVNEMLEAIQAQAAPVTAPVVVPAEGIGVTTPVLMFMFFVIAALGGIVLYLTRERITGVFSSAGAPTVKKARAKRASPEVLGQANNLRAEITNTERLIGTMKGQHDAGLISDSTHKELRARNEKKIKDAKAKLKKLGV
jgi:hypothetical protein